jgi:hypothetical protein
MAETREPPETPPPASSPRPATQVALGLSGRNLFVGMAVGTLIVAVVLGLVLSHASTPPAYGPSGWTVFHDPSGYFTISLPPGWTADGGESGTGTTGDATGSYTETDYAWVAEDPANGGEGPIVAISYYPLPNAFARQYECRAFPSPSATFAGLPAAPIADGWIVATTAAHYQLNYGFPPNTTAHTTPPTPVPAVTATAGTDLSAQVAATFRPTPRTPLSC